MQVYDVRLKSVDETEEAPRGEKRKAAGISGQAGQKGVQIRLPVQTEFVNILL